MSCLPWNVLSPEGALAAAFTCASDAQAWAACRPGCTVAPARKGTKPRLRVRKGRPEPRQCRSLGELIDSTLPPLPVANFYQRSA